MREILFRGKRLDNGEWVEGGILVDGDYFAICVYSDYHGWHEFVEVIPETIGQYTGLTDKNGTKIFEGDVVKAMYRIKYKEDYVLGTVVFENGTFKLSVVGTSKKGEFTLIASSIEDYKKTSMYAIENNFIFRGYSLEVIGNIHDNPELMKEGIEKGR